MSEAYYEIDGRFYCGGDVDTILEETLVGLLDAAYTRAKSDGEFIRSLHSWKNNSFGEGLWDKVRAECKVRYQGILLTQVPQNSRIFYHPLGKSS